MLSLRLFVVIGVDPSIQITLEMIRDAQLGITLGSYSKYIIDFIFLLQWRRFISGFLHPRNPLTTMLRGQCCRVNQTSVNGFSKGRHFLSGSNVLAFSGSKENVSLLSKFVNLHIIDSLSSWLWENHFKVENSNSCYETELNLLLTAQQ